jgi:hypothetical protein
MRLHLLVFDDGTGEPVDLRLFVDSLDPQAKMFAFDGHVGFIESGLTVSQISDRFLKFAGSSLYYLTEITTADYSGRMPEKFWAEFKHARRADAAE